MGLLDLIKQKPSEIAQTAMVRAVLSRVKAGTYGEIVAKVLLPLIENDVPIAEAVKGGIPSIEKVFDLLDKPISQSRSTLVVQCPHCGGYHLTETNNV